MIGNQEDAATILAWHHSQDARGAGDDLVLPAPEGWTFLGQGISRGAYSKDDVTYKVPHETGHVGQSAREVENVERVRSISGLPCYVPAASEHIVTTNGGFTETLVIAMETCPGERGIFVCASRSNYTYRDGRWGFHDPCACPGTCRWEVEREMTSLTGIGDIHLYNVLVETILNDDGSWGNEIYYLIDLG